MEKEKKKRHYIDISLPQPSSRDLRGRQSVRATFKLTQRAIEAMSAVSIHLGIKQKSLFDHLIDDINALEIIAQEVDIQKIEAPRRIQKTYVLSRKTLSCLDQAAKEFMNYFLPVILRALPMPSDIEALKTAEEGGQ